MNRGSAKWSRQSARGRPTFNEAPIHESGKLIVKLANAGRLRPSMRPRFMNRGSGSGTGTRRRARRPSMRPRFMNRGSGTGPEARAIRARAFNEAPIHESGKWRWSITIHPWSSGAFNEAPIHESGKWSCTSPWGCRSIRPFNEAPIHESGK